MMSLPDFKYKQIIVHVAGGSGERLRFSADNIILEDKEGHVLVQHSCHRIFALFIIGETSLTSVLIKQCSSFGFPIVLLGRNMRPIATIYCGAEGNTLLRMRQYGASETRNLEIAKELIRQKIKNQIQLIKNLRRLSADDNAAVSSLKEIDVDAAEDYRELMGIEGTASRIFFSAYFRPLGWKRREPRCKPDIYNLLLDIGYTYLFQFIAALLSLYGFDLYCGVLHRFFYQRMSLVCDIIEPFRCIIDQRVRKAYNLGQINEKDFYFHSGHWNLEWKNQSHYIQLFFKDILKEKESLFLYCQKYYRFFIREKRISEFPVFVIGEGIKCTSSSTTSEKTSSEQDSQNS